MTGRYLVHYEYDSQANLVRVDFISGEGVPPVLHRRWCLWVVAAALVQRLAGSLRRLAGAIGMRRRSAAGTVKISRNGATRPAPQPFCKIWNGKRWERQFLTEGEE